MRHYSSDGLQNNLENSFKVINAVDEAWPKLAMPGQINLRQHSEFNIPNTQIHSTFELT